MAGTTETPAKSPLKCGASTCSSPLVEWDAHALCLKCRQCSPENTCSVCASWTEETRKKAVSWMASQIKEEPVEAECRPVIEVEDDDDNDDIILVVDSVDTGWIKKEPSNIPHVKVECDGDVIMILSDDEDDDVAEVIVQEIKSPVKAPNSPEGSVKTSPALHKVTAQDGQSPIKAPCVTGGSVEASSALHQEQTKETNDAQTRSSEPQEVPSTLKVAFLEEIVDIDDTDEQSECIVQQVVCKLQTSCEHKPAKAPQTLCINMFDKTEVDSNQLSHVDDEHSNPQLAVLANETAVLKTSDIPVPVIPAENNAMVTSPEGKTPVKGTLLNEDILSSPDATDVNEMSCESAIALGQLLSPDTPVKAAPEQRSRGSAEASEDTLSVVSPSSKLTPITEFPPSSKLTPTHTKALDHMSRGRHNYVMSRFSPLLKNSSSDMDKDLEMPSSKFKTVPIEPPNHLQSQSSTKTPPSQLESGVPQDFHRGRLHPFVDKQQVSSLNDIEFQSSEAQRVKVLKMISVSKSDVRLLPSACPPPGESGDAVPGESSQADEEEAAVDEEEKGSMVGGDYDSDGWEVGSDENSASLGAMEAEHSIKSGTPEDSVDKAELGLDQGSSKDDGAVIESPVAIATEGQPISPIHPVGLLLATDSTIALHNQVCSGDSIGDSSVKEENVKLEKESCSKVLDDTSDSVKNPRRSARRMEKKRKKEKGRVKVERNLPDLVMAGCTSQAVPVFNCHRCFESFSDKKDLAQHLKHHPKVTRIVCEYCSTILQSSSSLKYHLKRCYMRKRHLRSSKNKCMKKEKEKHDLPKSPKRESKKEESELKCSFCEKTFHQRVGLQIHISIVHLKSCTLQTSVNGSLKSEFKLYDPKLSKKWSCPLCLMKHLYTRSLHAHMTKVHGTSLLDFVMANAKKESTSNTAYDADSFFMCPLCHLTYKDDQVCLRHARRKHKVSYHSKDLIVVKREHAPRVIHHCKTCKMSYRSQYLYTAHCAHVKGCEKKYQCNLCQKLFPTKVMCAQHIQRHLKEQAPVEEAYVPQKRDGSLVKLEGAQSLVKGEHSVGETVSSNKPDDKFLDRKKGSAAKKRRTDDKFLDRKKGFAAKKRVKSAGGEFKCKTCQESFEKEYLLAKHELIHSGSDPWHCYVCFKIFFLRRSIVAHMQKAHKEEVYCKKCYCLLVGKSKRKLCVDCDKSHKSRGLKCGFCKTDFLSPSQLAQHILTHNDFLPEPSQPKCVQPEASAPELAKASKSSSKMLASKELPSEVPKSSKTKLSSKTKPSSKIQASKEEPLSEMHKKGRTSYKIQASKEEPLPEMHKSASARVLRSMKDQCPEETILEGLPKKKPRKASPSASKDNPQKVNHEGRTSYKKSVGRSPPKKTLMKSPQSGLITGDVKNVCKKCGKEDISFSDLTKHARTHLDCRSEYQCNACQKLFPCLDDIEDHMATAHMESVSYTVAKSTYQCQFCGMDFANVFEARKHVLSTNFSCQLDCAECGKTFDRQGDLMVHMISVHAQYLECDRCSAQFTKQVDLQNHIRQHVFDSAP